MGNLTTSQSESVINALKNDNVQKLQTLFTTSAVPVNTEITDGRTAIILCAIYDSQQCLTCLIENGNDINIPDKRDNSTALILAAKFGYNQIINILISHNCQVEAKNAFGLNALDIAIIRGNYETCLFLLDNTSLTVNKSIENYQALNEQLNFPKFNLELFYHCLINKISLDKVPSFANVGGKRRRQFEGKVPDPNESWIDFVKRLYRLELYQPPLVDADQVQNKNTLYMRMQTGLVEMEYGVKMKLNRNENPDIEMMEERKVNRPNDEEKRLTNNFVLANQVDEPISKIEGDNSLPNPLKRELNETEEQLSQPPKTGEDPTRIVLEPEKLIMKENLSA